MPHEVSDLRHDYNTMPAFSNSNLAGAYSEVTYHTSDVPRSVERGCQNLTCCQVKFKFETLWVLDTNNNCEYKLVTESVQVGGITM